MVCNNGRGLDRGFGGEGYVSSANRVPAEEGLSRAFGLTERLSNETAWACIRTNSR